MIRVTGPDVRSIVDPLFSKSLEEAEPRKALFGRFSEGEELIDEGLLTYFQGPHSFTGEDMVELSVHASPYIQQRLLQALLDRGCRMAEQGEFTMRAFFNGKMDLSQAEGVADLIAAKSQAAHKMAMHQMRGGFSEDIRSLRQRLIDLASLLELELDFSDEDVEFADRDQLLNTIEEVRNRLQKLIDSFSLGNAIKQGIPVAIVGVPNVGKSTLLNALMNEDRAIVSDIAGTTRDTVEDEIVLEGVGFRFIDTAGIRDTANEVEALGVERTYQNVRKASVVLYMIDASSDEKEDVEQHLQNMREEGDGDKTVILVVNKIDQADEPEKVEERFKDLEQVVFLSASQGEGIDALKDQLVNLVEGGDVGMDQMVTNERHYEALSKAREGMDRVKNGMDQGMTGDLLALDMRDALHHLGRITGEITTDDLLGNIFANFCIGK
jgi:tRNA modification GTPase